MTLDLNDQGGRFPAVSNTRRLLAVNRPETGSGTECSHVGGKGPRGMSRRFIMDKSEPTGETPRSRTGTSTTGSTCGGFGICGGDGSRVFIA